jgi:putative Ca2+/H+ antiporter (TMEM165/GDT1 family)
MHLAVVAAVFPLVFLGELPDKTMFASLVLASRGRPLSVWFGAVAAFTIHVAIAVSVGVAVFHLLPARAVDVVVAAMFLAGALYSWLIRNKSEARVSFSEAGSAGGAFLTAVTVIFVAEWGDLTQILTANLAARYHAPLSVAFGSILALCTVAAIAVASGANLLRFVSVHTLRVATSVVLAGLGAFELARAATG